MFALALVAGTRVGTDDLTREPSIELRLFFDQRLQCFGQITSDGRATTVLN